MAMVNHEGRLVANLSQVTKVFKTEAEYTAFVNNVTVSGASLNAFVIFKCWERPYVMEAEGKQVVLADANPTGTAIPNFELGKKYTKNDVVTDGNYIFRALRDIDEATQADLANNFDVIAAEYAAARPALAGVLPQAGELYSMVGPNGETRFYFIKKTLNDPLSDTNRLDTQTDEFVVDLQKPHVPEIPDFQASYSYAKHEAITYNGLLYRAKNAFVSGAEFSAADFELISRVTHAIEDFVPNHHYVERELILHDNAVYAARADFTSGATFDKEDWLEIGQEDHIFFYDVAQGYPERCIVINGNDVYVTLKEVPAGTDLGDKASFLLLSYVPQEMTQAEFDALDAKPAMTIITDSIYDIKLSDD